MKENYLDVLRGHVYIAINDKIPNLLKIGRTQSIAKKPEERIKEGSRGPFVYGSYQKYWSKEVDNCFMAENYLHNVFREFNDGKEFFRLEPEIAEELAEKALKSLDRLTIKLDKEVLKKTDEEFILLKEALEALEATLSLMEDDEGDDEKELLVEAIQAIKATIEL